ncbi:MAG: hypothetical protein JWN48_1920 [Myxococcaceae bacterium]|nr:hypothetical protein [Myxococcaceae bacterium]
MTEPSAHASESPAPTSALAQDGVFLDGWSLAEQPVSVALTVEALCIRDLAGQQLRLWPMAGLHVDAMQEGHAYHLTHASAPHEQLLLQNPELAVRVLERAEHVAVLPGGKHKVAYGLRGLALLAALMAALYFSAPRLSLFVARRIPLAQERALGGELEFLLQLDKCRSQPEERMLTELLAELGERGDVKYDVHIARIDAPNAFALPGGVILVTRGFLREAQSADEISGVLAHELEHIAQRHVLAGALRGALLTALWSITLGDYSGLLVLDPSTAYRIANLEFSRDDEQAADASAVTRLHRAGLSHAGLTRFFERLSRKHGDGAPAWLSTHPSTAARIEALKAVPDVRAPRAPLSKPQLEQLRATCRG